MITQIAEKPLSPLEIMLQMVTCNGGRLISITPTRKGDVRLPTELITVHYVREGEAFELAAADGIIVLTCVHGMDEGLSGQVWPICEETLAEFRIPFAPYPEVSP